MESTYIWPTSQHDDHSEVNLSRSEVLKVPSKLPKLDPYPRSGLNKVSLEIVNFWLVLDALHVLVAGSKVAVDGVDAVFNRIARQALTIEVAAKDLGVQVSTATIP
ncbi:hypothetical protein LEN26_007728 [Aphanomyces euteiches]|nr:hypothetical protein AeMF1_020759 [Aphanomyces euteiches]KAH9131365.1 hypothetical protein LEN26_007728 [Aphanomyces euteiches]KAH9181887.1 hypothetical protein AeNC1_016137 [Aphanomyces euteiches]